jgi:hypothetical protein
MGLVTESHPPPHGDTLRSTTVRASSRASDFVCGISHTESVCLLRLSLGVPVFRSWENS